MLAQYLVLLGAISLQKSMKKSIKAVSSPQIEKERTFHVHLLMESFYVIFKKYVLGQGFSLSFVLNLFLIFHQISGSCSYRMVLLEKRV